MSSQSTKPARGMRDFLPADVRRRAFVIDAVTEVYERYGFEPLETPAVENLETLMGKYGEEGNQLIFKILKRGEQAEEALREGGKELADLALRYDLTVPLARVVAEYRAQLPKFFKRYQIQPVWRADRPARGRFREFYQCDVDVLGSRSMVVEAELCAAVSDVLTRLGFANFVIRVNHRQILNGVLDAAGIPPERAGDALVAVDKLDKIGRTGVDAELQQRGITAAAASKLLGLFEQVAASEQTAASEQDPAKGSLVASGQTTAREQAAASAQAAANRQPAASGQAAGSDKVPGSGQVATSGEVAASEQGAASGRVAAREGAAASGEQATAASGVVPTTPQNREPINSRLLAQLEAFVGEHAAAQRGLSELREVLAYAATTSASGRIQIDPSLARGLSYYTGAIMEIAVPDLAGSLGGGGRYDNLVGMFLGQDVPACGFSLGLERIIVVMTERGMFPSGLDGVPADVMVTLWNAAHVGEALALARELRAAGLRVDVYPEPDKIGKQFKYASSRGIPKVAVLGEDEIAKGVVALKDMQSGEQHTVPRTEAAAAVRG